MEQVLNPPFNRISFRIAIGTDSDEWFTLDDNKQLIHVVEKYPCNVIYISEEDALL
jgi:hypothetical protein